MTDGPRDATPALGTRGRAAGWRRATEGARVALHQARWKDALWSDIFRRETGYAGADPAPGEVAAAARRMRTGTTAAPAHGPFIKAPVWTWEVPLYFWFGGIAAGSSFVALACDLSRDHRSAATARKVAVAAALTCPPLLIADLGRPARFLNMLRIFKPRSPMNTGAWALVAFSAIGSGAVAADATGRPGAARALGGANAVVGGYLGSYAGVLLAATAVPVWARSRLFLGPIFVSTAAATGAAATRLVLVARGLPVGHPTRRALGTLETGAMVSELVLSTANRRRLGPVARPLHEGRSGWLFRAGELAIGTGLALRLVSRRVGPAAHHVASALYLAGGLALRYAWVEAGRASANDDEMVAALARDGSEHRSIESTQRRPLPLPAGLRSVYPEAVRRLSLAVERALGPGG